MFYTSFLVKEGKAKIFFDSISEEEGGSKLPLIVPVRKQKQDDQDGATSGDNKHQVLMTISMNDWSRLKVKYIGKSSSYFWPIIEAC